VILRYFNASGAMHDGSLGEFHRPETHIIPIALEVALGKRAEFEIYGNDYDTPDGTCIRDYIHVVDLGEAHIKALEYLKSKNRSDIFNLGVGRGYSNNEVIKTVESVVGKEIPKKYSKRREGDPAQIYADNAKARRELGWQPQYSDLTTIVETAWKWHQTHPNGF
jgi:UDP-glucose 4-epimerase